MATVSFDQAKAEAFGGKMLAAMNAAAVVLMTSIGHRTRLFDVLADLPPSTSAEIASAAKLNERYVREWLGAMVTGGVIEYEPAAKRYYLPTEHVGFLTRAAGGNNMGVTAQFVPVLAAVEDEVVAAFAHGRGVPYSAYKRFHEVMAEESANTVLAVLLSDILPLVPGLLAQLEQGIDVLDIGCGSGRAMNFLAAQFPRSRFRGVDLCEQAVATAQSEADLKGLLNVGFTACDVAKLSDVGQYDLITAFDAIHDQGQPALVLAKIQRALKPAGVFLMQDIAGSSHVHHNIGRPLSPFIYTISCLHCMSVSLAQGGVGLGAAWGQEIAEEMLRRAGFGTVSVSELSHDIMNSYYVARK